MQWRKNGCPHPYFCAACRARESTRENSKYRSEKLDETWILISFCTVCRSMDVNKCLYYFGNLAKKNFGINGSRGVLFCIHCRSWWSKDISDHFRFDHEWSRYVPKNKLSTICLNCLIWTSNSSVEREIFFRMKQSVSFAKLKKSLLLFKKILQMILTGYITGFLI